MPNEGQDNHYSKDILMFFTNAVFPESENCSEIEMVLLFLSV